MKTINVLLLFLASVLALSSCQDLEKVLPKNEGTWNLVSETISEYEDGVAVVTDSVSNFSPPEVYTFNEDGTGTYTDDGTTVDFTWTYNPDTDILGLTVGSTALEFEVQEWTKNEMKLFTTLEFDFFGVNFLNEYVFNFEKAD